MLSMFGVFIYTKASARTNFYNKEKTLFIKKVISGKAENE